MEVKRQFGLNYTEDFSVACTINNLNYDEVLQYFIDKVSFYAFNGGEMDSADLWATQVILDYREEVNAQISAVMDKKVQRLVIRFIGLLSDLADNTHLSASDKRKESFLLMEEWANEMLPLVDFPVTFQLDEQHTADLTFDFNLLCTMNGVTAGQVLQYFINRISLSTERGLNLLGFIETNSCMALFGIIALNQSGKIKRVPLQQDIFKWYTEKLVLLDEELRKEPDAQKRTNIYRAFYLEWYQSLRKNIN